ncbi:DUF1963 domain-containing protein [Luteolibacter arcticus]
MPRALFPAGTGDIPAHRDALVQSHLDLFPAGPRKIAYLFVTDSEELLAATSEPYGGENAVILQTSGTTDAPFLSVATGPTLQPRAGAEQMEKLQEVEFGIAAWEGEDPAFLTDSEILELPDEDQESYLSQSGGHKIGGIPGFVQAEQFPDDLRTWHLLLQFDTTEVPFHIDFGDNGVGYLFIDSNATEGRFLWQCT